MIIRFLTFRRSFKKAPFTIILIHIYFSFSRFLYPALVVLTVSTITFPPGIGQFLAGDLNTHDQVSALFSNFTWTLLNSTVAEQAVLNHWTTEWTNVYVTLTCYTLFTVGKKIGNLTNFIAVLSVLNYSGNHSIR